MPEAFAFCLCADDYAITPGVSRGILEGLDAGAITATSVMTTSPWWPESAGALRAYVSRADIGLHLNLTLAAPLGRMPELAPAGRLPNVRTLIQMAGGGRLPAGEIIAEIDRQCEQFVTIFGRPPDHIDGHQHVHALAAVRSLLFKVLARRGWRPWLRDSSDRLARLLWRAGRRKALALRVLAHSFRADVANRGFAINDGFAGFSPFDPNTSYAGLFETYLRAPGARHLIMCHPGYVDDELRRLDPVLETREQELNFITSRLSDIVKRKCAIPSRMSTLTNKAASPE